jgi:hypothetical protein
MKGKIMTTENTTATEIETPEQIAEQFVKHHNSMQIEEEFVNHYNTIESLKARVKENAATADHFRQKFNRLEERVAEFLKSHISDNEDASVDDMKEFAESLGIELTKEIKVTFGVEVTVEMTVPIGFDIDDITESNFTVSAEFDGMTDVEVEDTQIDINEFDVEED